MHVLIAALHRPTRPTGVCRHAVNLALCLVDMHQVDKVTLLIGAWQQNYFETAFSMRSEKIDLLSIEIKNSSIGRNIWYLSGLPKVVRHLRPDIVHLSFPLPFIRSLFPCPVVSTIHDLYPYECPENFGYPQVIFNQLFLKTCIGSSDGLSCVSNVTLDKLRTYFPNTFKSKSISTVYNYVDFSQSNPSKPISIDLNPQDLFILSVAQHRKNKNLDLLIQAYALLIEDRQLPDSSKLIIVGSSGPETKSLESLIQKRSLGKQVRLLSSISDDELCWLYNNCTIYVAASSTEGFCLPLVEALHFTSRVVCSDIPIFREVGSSSCIYFSLGSDATEELRSALSQSFEGSSYEEIVHQDRVKLSKFSKANVAEDYLKLYSAVRKSIGSQIVE